MIYSKSRVEGKATFSGFLAEPTTTSSFLAGENGADPFLTPSWRRRERERERENIGMTASKAIRLKKWVVHKLENFMSARKDLLVYFL